MSAFKERYGPCALVAGASAGLGAAFARKLAELGLDLVLLARRGPLLEDLAASLRSKHGVAVETGVVDLGERGLAPRLGHLLEGREIGLLVYNAAHSAIGPFLESPLDEHLRVLEVNCRGPLVLVHALGRAMARRGRGGIVLMTSLAGSQGNPLLTSYAASKAFNLVLAEGLWAELTSRGVDVVACRAGATQTPGFEASRPRRAVPMMEPEAVVARALASLGHGPSMVPGALNRLAAFTLGRLVSRRMAIRIMGRATARLYG
ncbi:MAG TPA: SDR family NAD(P)-dependent oxidoreductase [Anaeromyxobacteraceae bacterium]|nr:SDR family NAD(P)-dependent oxidoreductase [Anaeromyxobacteraceae bacterium]